MDIPDDEDGFPWSTSIPAAFGLSTISGTAIMATLGVVWILELRWWALLLVAPVALLAALLALPAFRTLRVRMALATRVRGLVPRVRFKSTSDWLAFRVIETLSIVFMIILGRMGAGWWALVPLTLVAVLRMRWLTMISAWLVFGATVILVQYCALPLRPW